MSPGKRIVWSEFEGGWIATPGMKRAHHVGQPTGYAVRAACLGLIMLTRSDERGAVAFHAGGLNRCGKCRAAVERRLRAERTS